MALTKEDVASRAFTRIGGSTITSFTASSAEAIVVNQAYYSIVDNALSMHNWSFASDMVVLTRLSDTPADDDRWSAAYQMPTAHEAVSMETVLVNGAPIEYERFQDQIWCNAYSGDRVVAVYQYRPPESSWPPYFTEYVVLMLAEALATGVARNEDMAKLMAERAEIQFRRAKSRDSAGGQTARKMRLNKLISVRHSSG